MHLPPMLGDLVAGANPDVVAGRNAVKELDETGDAAGAAGRPFGS
jgi:hypothetical protein